ncbi:uncharacterized protein [Aristolochia californica]|uniref:uncharacterized protein isoform X1 n=1 Tax=Aristolochia californica TaxID=171875 RepID=UPI0035E314BA
MRNITFTLGGDEGRFCGAIQWLLFSLSFGAETIWIWWVFAGRFGIYDSGASTVFLIRALQQLGMMFDPVHVYATAIYIISVTFALVCALLRCSFLQIHSKILTILAVIEEICTLIWNCPPTEVDQSVLRACYISLLCSLFSLFTLLQKFKVNNSLLSPKDRILFWYYDRPIFYSFSFQLVFVFCDACKWFISWLL